MEYYVLVDGKHGDKPFPLEVDAKVLHILIQIDAIKHTIEASEKAMRNYEKELEKLVASKLPKLR